MEFDKGSILPPLNSDLLREQIKEQQRINTQRQLDQALGECIRIDRSTKRKDVIFELRSHEIHFTPTQAKQIERDAKRSISQRIR